MALPACQECAGRALRDGDGVLVYPGSDLDAFRPFSQRHRVELGQRRGFLRLARRTGVSVLPVVSTGTHEQLIVLSRGDALSRRLDGRRFLRTGVLPLTLSVPWGLSLGFVPYLPLPAQTSVSFLEPISPEELFRDAGGDEDTMLERAYRLVERRMQAGLDELARGRRFLLGRPEDRRAAR